MSSPLYRFIRAASRSSVDARSLALCWAFHSAAEFSYPGHPLFGAVDVPAEVGDIEVCVEVWPVESGALWSDFYICQLAAVVVWRPSSSSRLRGVADDRWNKRRGELRRGGL